ncbi:MAG: thiamine diphosphokinase [Candidatus Schekmanbacteria bacterium]|nr:thiamine diphosphokinase [Candidatus Schekmanbacteria bacterium]
MKAIIICSGDIKDSSLIQKSITTGDIVICADGGYRHAEKAGILPNYLIGDFDSIKVEALNSAVAKGTKVIKHPPEKDQTDTELAVLLAISLHADEILLLGATGSRLDHVLANIHLLVKGIQAGKKITIADSNNEITLISESGNFHSSPGEIFSLLPMTEVVTGITISGLKYPLKDGTMELGAPYGVSNEATSDKVTIEINSGLLLVIRAKD